MAAYKALTLVERIFLYKRCGINSKDFSAYQEWVNIPGLLTEKDIAPMGGADVFLDFAYAAKPRLCLYSTGLK